LEGESAGAFEIDQCLTQNRYVHACLLIPISSLPKVMKSAKQNMRCAS
jgi:hypothetical protein